MEQQQKQTQIHPHHMNISEDDKEKCPFFQKKNNIHPNPPEKGTKGPCQEAYPLKQQLKDEQENDSFQSNSGCPFLQTDLKKKNPPLDLQMEYSYNIPYKCDIHDLVQTRGSFQQKELKELRA